MIRSGHERPVVGDPVGGVDEDMTKPSLQPEHRPTTRIPVRRRQCFTIKGLEQRSIAARSGAALAALASLTLATAAHATDGYFQNGLGAKAKGQAGAAIADPQDSLSIGANPAAATALGHRFDIGADVFVPDRSATISGNGAGLDGRYSGNGLNPFLMPEFGYVRPLPGGVSLGVAVYGNGGMNTVYKRNPFAAFGATGHAGVDLKQVFVAPTLAVEVAPGQSLGVSPLGVLQSFKAAGLQPFAVASADPARFTNRGTDWSTGAGVRVGYLGRFGPVSLGAFYQSEVLAGAFHRYEGLFAERGGFDVPASWGAGLAVRASEALTVAVDVKRIAYSSIRSIGTPLAPLLAGQPFGAADGPGFGWRDISVVKVGLRYAVSPSLTLRAGYGYAQNPVRPSQTLLNVLAPGVVTHHVTAGATWTTASGTEITGFVMHAPRNTVKGRGSIPVSYGGGEADVALAETALGVSVGWKL